MTTKSGKHLAVNFSESDKATPRILVVSAARFNAQFKRVPRQRAKLPTTRLESAVGVELETLGTIIFSLVGCIGPDEAATVPLMTGAWNALVYSPNQELPATTSDAVIRINRLDDIDAAWNAVKGAVESYDPDMAALADSFETAFHNLQEASGRPVDLANVSAASPSILSRICERIESQVVAYGKALEAHRRGQGKDPEVLNELLRLAYNFADGARALIGLVVALCDLKPVLFWLTLAEQVELADQFARLPFGLVGKAKPSLERYRSVIAMARNQAFHDLFAFDRPFRVRLPEDALRSAELYLFREYARQKETALDFEDRRLVEVLQGFSKVPYRSVPLGFWDANVAVMEAVAALIRRLRGALLDVALERGAPRRKTN